MFDKPTKKRKIHLWLVYFAKKLWYNGKRKTVIVAGLNERENMIRSIGQI